jgi:large conductance mechanosensitive channel
METPNPVDLVKQAIALDPAQKALSFVDEFRKFALERNVMDLAVGVIIGAAVGKLVESMVKHIMMPLIGTVLPGEDSYLGWKWSIGGQEILYGQFIGELLNFLIVALALFVFIVKFLGWVMRARTQAAAEPEPATREEALLAEIRDLLKRPASGASGAQLSP